MRGDEVRFERPGEGVGIEGAYEGVNEERGVEGVFLDFDVG